MPSLPKGKASRNAELRGLSHSVIKSFSTKKKKKSLIKTTAASLFANTDIANHYADVNKAQLKIYAAWKSSQCITLPVSRKISSYFTVRRLLTTGGL